jgi:hypothetical protein
MHVSGECVSPVMVRIVSERSSHDEAS